MKLSLFSLTFFAVGAFFSLPKAARAEIVEAESIEWVVADSDRVVLGKVVKVEHSSSSELVTVDVSKTIRGKHEGEATFLVPVRSGFAGAGWLKDGAPMMFCLIQRMQIRTTLPEKCDWVLRQGALGPSVISLDTAKSHQSIAPIERNFTVLKTPNAIIKCVEAYSEAIPPGRNVRSFSLEVPSESSAFRELRLRSSVFLRVPIDANLESSGRAWCHDNAVATRIRGARVLGNFKTEENVKILKTLLDDPDFDVVSGSQSFPDHILRIESQVYPVRAAAYQSLIDLGVEVERPITVVPLNRRIEPPSVKNRGM